MCVEQPCFNIRILARLSVEKNPGLFLPAARDILATNPFARFTVVGDGRLRQQLVELADMLEIGWAVHFSGMNILYFTIVVRTSNISVKGWLAEDLPFVLRGMDVLVNPSLRGWSETFCISNIEAMATGIPLITYAVGGIGEYVRPPAEDTGGQERPMVQVTPNALLVNDASPAAIAQAVDMLYRNITLRKYVGFQGRKTVLSYFSTDRQMRQYSELYRTLASSTIRSAHPSRP